MPMPIISLLSVPKTSFLPKLISTTPTLPSSTVSGGGGLVIECSSRPQKKGTKHHMKTRPRKTQPWDIKRKPTVYPPLPPLPPEWTLVSNGGDAAIGTGDLAASAPEPAVSTG